MSVSRDVLVLSVRRGTEVVVTGAPRKRLVPQGARGFESLPLRQSLTSFGPGGSAGLQARRTSPSAPCVGHESSPGSPRGDSPSAQRTSPSARAASDGLPARIAALRCRLRLRASGTNPHPDRRAVIRLALNARRLRLVRPGTSPSTHRSTRPRATSREDVSAD
jgi:hypothetical protein